MPNVRGDLLEHAGDGVHRRARRPRRVVGAFLSGSEARAARGSAGRRRRDGVSVLAATAGWVLTEMGRQPWIVQGLLKTADANSPAVSSAMVGFSMAVFVFLYALLLVLESG